MQRKSKSSDAYPIGPSPDYQAEDDHRTLTRATEIQGDPSRMRGVRKHHKKASRGLASVGKLMGGGR